MPGRIAFRIIPASAAIARPVSVMDVPNTVKGQTTGEAQAAYQDYCCDNQVAGLGQVYMVLYYVTDADCGNHTIQHEAYATDDCGLAWSRLHQPSSE